jgi:hypothetical protein
MRRARTSLIAANDPASMPSGWRGRHLHGTTGEGRDQMASASTRRYGPRKIVLTAGLVALLAGYAVAPGADYPVTAPAFERVAEEKPLRQTEQDAFAYAKATNAAVEIGVLRSETRSVFANPDGTFTDQQYAEPVRVLRDGTWVEANADLEPQPDGSFAPKAAAFGLRVSGGGDGPFIIAERAGRSMGLSWPTRLPPPDVSGHRATYSEVLPGVDLVVNVGVTKFSHVLVIKTAKAAQLDELASLDLTLHTDQIDVRQTENGGLAAVDAAGGQIFQAAAPIMWDAGAATEARTRARSASASSDAAAETPPQSASRAPLKVDVTGEKLTLIPDRAMLADAATRFPVYVDPVWTDTRASGWTMVNSGYPNEEDWRFSGNQGVGECPVSSGTCAGTGKKRLYYALPTPYAGKTILSAEFAVTMTHTFDGSAKGVSLYHAKSGISSATNWTNQPALGNLQESKSPTATHSSCTSTNQNVRFNATSIVTTAAAPENKWSTTTFAIRANSESDHTYWKRFCGNALLSVKYNRKPNIPLTAQLSINPGAGACVDTSARPYTATPPTLNAVLTDPDKSTGNNEQLTAEFKIVWRRPGDTSDTVRPLTTGKKASGSPFSVSLASLNLPENVVIGWEVRAHDGTEYGPWSSEGAQPICQFVYDKTQPDAPDIDSAVYLPLDSSESTFACAPDEIPPASEEEGPSPSWRGSVGTYGTFVFDSPSTDVVEYQFGFDTTASPTQKLVPATPGGPVTVTWMPEEPGLHTITALAKDASGRQAAAICYFSVPTRLSTAEWTLADEPAEEAVDQRGHHPAKAGAGVTFGAPGPKCITTSECMTDRAVTLTGTATGYLSTADATAVVDTSQPYSVTAWVRLTDTAADRVAVSQDGAGRPGFQLGFDGTSKKWVFGASAEPVRGLGGWYSTSTTPVIAGEWTHLVGVYDPIKSTMQLYVNGVAQPVTAVRRSSWRSYGAVQLGRRTHTTGYTGHWAGDLADVNLFDRIVVAREAKVLAARRTDRKAYWTLDEQIGEQTLTYDEGGPALTLAGGARVDAPDIATAPPADWPMVGAGHLLLFGTDDYASTGSAVTPTNGSFTITARARLAAGECTQNTAVVAQSGTKESGFVLRCGAGNTWQAVLPQLDGTDAAKPPVVLDSGRVPSSDLTGSHLALVYDAFLRRATFYVDGEEVGTQDALVLNWNAAGAFNIGRALSGGTYGSYFSGAVDEVRVYNGVLDPASIQAVTSPDAGPDV